MTLGILTSHPIQYQAPWFRALAKEVDLEVLYAHRQTAAEQGKAGFGVAFEWDMDLLSGYKHSFLRNVSTNPGVNHFSGCDTPEIAGMISGDAKRGTRNAKPFDAFIVCGWHLKSYWQAIRACRRAGVPVLVRGDSQLLTPRSVLKRWAKKVWYPPLLRQFDGFLTVGKRNREYLEHYGVPAEKIFFAPHFVDNEWFAVRAAEARTRASNLPSSVCHLRRIWGAGEETLVVLFVGKFQPIKRPQDLLQAMAILNAQSPTFNALPVFVGAGEMENELRDLAGRERLRFHFAGFKNQSELPAIYAAADVLILPSQSETWGLVVNEAMACGLPAIVSDSVGCAPDLIEVEKTGFTYPLGDCAQLARRLESLAQMKRNGHRFAPAIAEKMRAYSVAAAVNGTVEAVKSLKGEIGK